jgi:hypothetical protein
MDRGLIARAIQRSPKIGFGRTAIMHYWLIAWMEHTP